MGSSMPFEEALASRLSLFEPSLSQVQGFLEKRPPRFSPRITEFVQKFKENGKTVYLISGGFCQSNTGILFVQAHPKFCSNMFHQHEDICHQSNYSSLTNGTPMNVSDSKDDHSHLEESKVKTPEMTQCPNAVLSPVHSEGRSSFVEMPQKLADCDGLKEILDMERVI